MSPITIFVCLAICIANIVFGILPATKSPPPAQTSQAPLSECNAHSHSAGRPLSSKTRHARQRQRLCAARL